MAATIAIAGAVAMLSGASAFAESRHSEETRSRGNARETVRRERSSETRGNESRNEGRTYERRSSGGDSGRTWRNETRGETRGESSARGERRDRAERHDSGGTWRGESSSRGTQNRDAYRSNDRGSSSHGGTWNRGGSTDNRGGYDNHRGYDRNRGYSGNRQTFHHSGRITNYSRYGNGYRVWIAGAPYPYFVPLAYWHPSRFRIGLSINLGGYWNPGGYYDYYDGYYRDGYAYRGDSRGDLRGTVESVDYRRDTFVIRNEATGSFVTVISRDRRMRDLRPGDFVEMTGSWTRSGYFNAYDVDLLDYDRDRDRW